METELRQRITQWSTDLPPGCQSLEQEHAGIVHRLYSCIGDAYRSLLPRLQTQTDKPLYRKLERGYSSLILWSHSYGVDGGKVDAALEKSNDLRNIMIGILVNICTIILERLLPRVPGCDDDEWKSRAQRLDLVMSQVRHVISSETEDQDNQSTAPGSKKLNVDTLDRIASNIRTMIQTLADLGPLLEDAMIPDQHHDEPAATVDSSATAPNFVSLILHIFPKCNKATADGLSRALLQTARHVQLPEDQTTPDRRFWRAGALAESSIIDSALGTSIATTMSSYAETLREYLGNSDSPVSIKLPKLPDGGRKGKPVFCEACKRSVRARNEREWKQHLMADSRPYMCIEPDCPVAFQPFQTKKSWISHLSQHYGHSSRKMVVCPICEASYHTGPESVTLLANHLAYHLEPIAAEVIIPGVSFTGPSGEMESQEKSNDTMLSASSLWTSSSSGVPLTRRIAPKAPANKEEIPSLVEDFIPPPEAPSCDICGYRPRGGPRRFAGSMAKHRKLKHSTETSKVYLCPYPGCKAAYKNRPDGLQIHQREKGHFVESQPPLGSGGQQRKERNITRERTEPNPGPLPPIVASDRFLPPIIPPIYPPKPNTLLNIEPNPPRCVGCRRRLRVLDGIWRCENLRCHLCDISDAENMPPIASDPYPLGPSPLGPSPSRSGPSPPQAPPQWNTISPNANPTGSSRKDARAEGSGGP